MRASEFTGVAIVGIAASLWTMLSGPFEVGAWGLAGFGFLLLLALGDEKALDEERRLRHLEAQRRAEQAKAKRPADPIP